MSRTPQSKGESEARWWMAQLAKQLTIATVWVWTLWILCALTEPSFLPTGRSGKSWPGFILGEESSIKKMGQQGSQFPPPSGQVANSNDALKHGLKVEILKITHSQVLSFTRSMEGVAHWALMVERWNSFSFGATFIGPMCTLGPVFGSQCLSLQDVRDLTDVGPLGG